MEHVVRKWEYKKLALNEARHDYDEIDVLCDAGDDGWELVAVLPNGIAYLKRELSEGVASSPERSSAEAKQTVMVRPPRDVVASAAKAKYRDPATGATWSGRGRMATWLKRRVEAGEDIEKFLV
jgi:DNA-binding protein H-NS